MLCEGTLLTLNHIIPIVVALMPTATTTFTSEDVGMLSTSVISLKSSSPAAESSAAATLRSLYPRAAKAFLQRDIGLTYSLITSAFTSLTSPLYSAEDELTPYRRKWDILRITLETTVYASPPAQQDPTTFPAALRANQMLSSQSLVASLYEQSLNLFTPTNPPTKPSPFFLPHQILVTLVLASIKLGCPIVGKNMIEDWLARKNPEILSSGEGRLGYIKILELYCLHILPRLEEWDFAQDFLQYERELDAEMRQTMIGTIRKMHDQAIAGLQAKNTIPAVPVSSASTSRSVSPAPSSSSGSSVSTQTATPLTTQPQSNGHKGKGKDKPQGWDRVQRMSSLTSPRISPSLSSTSSQSIASATTSRTVTPASVNRIRPLSRSRKDAPSGVPLNRYSSSQGGSQTPIPRAPRSSSLRPPTTIHAPSTLALIRTYIQSTLQRMTKSQLLALFLLFVVFPVVSFVYRLRRRRFAAGLPAPGGTATAVRRRLRAGTDGIGIGLIGRVWEEACELAEPFAGRNELFWVLAMNTKILLIGGTGYIGGSVLSRLFYHPKVDAKNITVLVRSQEKADKLRHFQFNTVVGSMVDLGFLENLARRSDVVFSCADADDLNGIQAILAGLKKRKTATDTVPILIHTSGTGEIATEAKGMFPSDLIYDDMDLAQLETIPKVAPHRVVDLTIMKADHEGYVRTYILAPSTIWGIASNPLVEAGIQNPYSQQIPNLVRASLDRRQGGMVGKGLAIYPDVNIEEGEKKLSDMKDSSDAIDSVGDLYMTIFDAATRRPAETPHGREGFFFVENGEHTWYSISKEISRILVQKGIGYSGEPTAFTVDELVKYWGSEVMSFYWSCAYSLLGLSDLNFDLHPHVLQAAGNSYGSNARCRGNRARLLGWRPLKTKDDMIASIEAEVDAMLRSHTL
ncbi:hypothetical protein EIP86_002772 [Pleurotus ostreatoroseus]|nr:hypothetical protein EIP86_002772 [Pleurotus ostreatoroseus]